MTQEGITIQDEEAVDERRIYSISKEMRPPAVEAVQSTAQCTTYIFLCSVDFVRRLEESCINNYHKCPD